MGEYYSASCVWLYIAGHRDIDQTANGQASIDSTWNSCRLDCIVDGAATITKTACYWIEYATDGRYAKHRNPEDILKERSRSSVCTIRSIHLSVFHLLVYILWIRSLEYLPINYKMRLISCWLKPHKGTEMYLRWLHIRCTRLTEQREIWVQLYSKVTRQWWLGSGGACAPFSVAANRFVELDGCS